MDGRGFGARGDTKKNQRTSCTNALKPPPQKKREKSKAETKIIKHCRMSRTSNFYYKQTGAVPAATPPLRDTTPPDPPRSPFPLANATWSGSKFLHDKLPIRSAASSQRQRHHFNPASKKEQKITQKVLLVSGIREYVFQS